MGLKIFALGKMEERFSELGTRGHLIFYMHDIIAVPIRVNE